MRTHPFFTDRSGRRAWLQVAVFSLVFASACNRAQKFKEEPQFYQPERGGIDSGESYYSPPEAAPAAPLVMEKVIQPKKRIWILDFWNDTPVANPQIGKFAADELRRGLHETKKVMIPTDLSSNFTTSDFVTGDQVKVSNLVREGRKQGVAVVIIGRISKIVFRQKGDDVGLFRKKQSFAGVEAEIKIFDVAAGREMVAITRNGEDSAQTFVNFSGKGVESPEFRAELTQSALQEAVGRMIQESVRVVDKMTWEGRVAQVVGNKVYINAGKVSGLVSGDILRVLSNGEEIFDETNGVYLGRSRGQLKGTLEVVEYLGTDGAVTEVHTGANIQEGDVVQLY